MCRTYYLILHNTISNNSAQFGGGLFFTSPSILSVPVLRNTISWGNSANSGSEVYVNDQNIQPNFYYCDVQGGSASFGLNMNVFYVGTYSNNIDSDPLFVSPSNGSGTSFNGLTADWSLQTNSSCINSGDSLGTYTATDILNHPRVVDDYIDIGAIEYQGFVGIINYSLQNHTSVYPNPFSFETTVHTENLWKDATLELYNSFGQQVKSLKHIAGQTIVVQRGNLINGMYFLRLTEANKTLVNDKIIITSN
jgi:hypothetical protein